MLAQDALKAKVDGIVCSGSDLKFVKRILGSRPLLKVVPGIRPSWYKNKDDQIFTITPDEAIKRGADYLVVGRPILNTANPLDALENM